MVLIWSQITTMWDDESVWVFFSHSVSFHYNTNNTINLVNMTGIGLNLRFYVFLHFF